MDSFWRDLHYGLRMLARNPGVTAVAVLTLAFGIGANTAIFSVVDAIQLRPLPVREPEQIVRVGTSYRRGETELIHGDSSHPDFLDLRAQATAFEDLAWYNRRGAILETGEQVELLLTNDVSANYFTLLGIHPAAGRFFTEQDVDAQGAEPVVVLSYALWQRRFRGDPQIVGRAVTLSKRSFVVMGVAPQGFRGLDLFIAPDLWSPAVLIRAGEKDRLANRAERFLQVVGRLRPGAQLERAQAELNTIAARLASTYPASNADRKLSVAYEKDLRPGGRLGLLLMGVSGLVLLIACANIANLLFARGETRRREIALRLALGAGRLRLVRQLLTESLLLSLLGAASASLLASWVIQMLPAMITPGATRISFDFRLDVRVFAFTLGVALLSVFLFGLVPALRAARADLVGDLKTEPLSAAGRARRFSMRNALVVAQLALSVALLAGAGLLVRSLWNLRSADPGFDTRQNMLLLNYAAGFAGYDEARTKTLLREVGERLRELPGVEQVSLMRRFPLAGSGGGATVSLLIPGHEPPAGEKGIPVHYNSVDSAYFQTVGTRLLRGRAFNEQDAPPRQLVAIINETMARRFWPSEEPVGKHFQLIGPRGGDCEIVGVVQDGKYGYLREEPQPYLFLPLAQHFSYEITIAVVTAREPGLLASPVRTKLREVDKNVPIVDLFTLDSHMLSALYVDRLTANLSSSLGLVGLFLSTVGLYGVIAFLVSRRTREIGVRMALGAQHRDVFRLILAHGLKLAAVGMAAGLAGALALGRMLSSWLYGVSPTDPLTFAVVVLILAVVALLACYLPARRAARLNPVVALRYE